jgi:hypothetical protein
MFCFKFPEVISFSCSHLRFRTRAHHEEHEGHEEWNLLNLAKAQRSQRMDEKEIGREVIDAASPEPPTSPHSGTLSDLGALAREAPDKNICLPIFSMQRKMKNQIWESIMVLIFFYGAVNTLGKSSRKVRKARNE